MHAPAESALYSIKIVTAFVLEKARPFTKRVYKVVLGIPLGETRTYKWVAQKAGNPRASRAVGQILKNNPYTLIIPCHRVVASGNKLGGYSKGLKAKRMLLGLEREIKTALKC